MKYKMIKFTGEIVIDSRITSIYSRKIRKRKKTKNKKSLI
uniref:Uncharacterized protein n=1 Tax=Rhizophora mucronata TaxID=61149 RepID=A0A2P2NCI9_RHIMU